MEESRRKDVADAENDLHLKRKELLNYRNLIEQQEKEIESYRARIKKEQIEKEKSIQKEMAERERYFAEREKHLAERQRELEKETVLRLSEIEALKNHLEKEIFAKENSLQQMTLEFEKEKSKYREDSRRRIEETSKDYVSEALSVLDKKEKQFHFMSKIWSGIGAGSLVVGLALLAWMSVKISPVNTSDITWELIVYTSFKGMLIIAFAIGLSRYSFVFSKSYMREALKNADRRHAINFGKFYLESFGATAEWAQVKEAFEHWNITSENAFSSDTADKSDISRLEKMAGIIESTADKIKAIK
ncbi:MAG: hypothetical protein R3F38_14525, partial [Gammaproteobacteria bacterium]